MLQCLLSLSQSQKVTPGPLPSSHVVKLTGEETGRTGPGAQSACAPCGLPPARTGDSQAAHPSLEPTPPRRLDWLVALVRVQLDGARVPVAAGKRPNHDCADVDEVVEVRRRDERDDGNGVWGDSARLRRPDTTGLVGVLAECRRGGGRRGAGWRSGRVVVSVLVSQWDQVGVVLAVCQEWGRTRWKWVRLRVRARRGLVLNRDDGGGGGLGPAVVDAPEGVEKDGAAALAMSA